MKEKIFTVRENFKFEEVEQRKKIIRENIIKIIKNQQEKEVQRIYNHSKI